MARHDHHFADASFGLPEAGAPIEALIRPALRLAFPLPEGCGGEDRFRVLLDALAQRTHMTS